ncbi:MAG: helix-turn-helix domain-containing protein [Candidatus Gastranaerophilales bacterium]|nr:helix-turn-helix domain-containing protein [Candidatus Gastranaerophilales bacterium]
MNIDKLLADFPSHDEMMKEHFQDPDFQREYLNLSLAEYLDDGDFNKFYKCLEKVIKARGSVTSFAKKVNIERANLYTLFNGEKVPRLDTIAKILKELGYTLSVA